MVALLNDPRVTMAACRHSPNAFAEYVMAEEGIRQARLQRVMQRHLTLHDDCYMELPRGHTKTVQMALRLGHEIGKNPAVRIKLVQQTDHDATDTTRMIRRIIDSPRFRDVFPWVVLDRSESAASSFRVMDLRRRSPLISRDPTVKAKGIFGNAGGRADILVGDDICDLKNAIQKPALREQVKDFWVTNWLPMCDSSGGKRPKVWKVGTPYHVSDITADWRREHVEDGTLLRLPVTMVGGEFVSPWPEGMSSAELAHRRKKYGPIGFGRAYELNPISSEQIVFPAEWLDDAIVEAVPSPDTADGRGQMVAAFDWAATEQRQKNDPDYSVCLIGWRTNRGHVYVTRMLRIKAPFPTFMKQAIAMCVEEGVQQAVGEANGMQKALVQQFNREAPFPMRGVNRITDKQVRAEAKGAFVESGRFHLLGKSDQGKLVPIKQLMPVYDEMTTFPVGDHDDTVDAALDLMDMAGSSGGFEVEEIKKRPSTVARIYE